MKKAREWVKKNPFLIAVFFIACFLMFLNLGNRYFWGDEVHLLVISEAIGEHGYPYVKGLEGINEQFTNHVFYTENYVYTFHPWLSLYVISVPMMLFGKYNEFAIKFPFALFGIVSILMTYFLALEFGFNKRTAKIATILALTSTAIYLHSRQANYYSLSILLALLMIYFYLRFIKTESIKHMAFFALVCVLFFYTQFLMFAGAFAGIAAHFAYISYRDIREKGLNKKTRRTVLFFASIFLTVALTLPWFLFAKTSERAVWIGLSGFVFNNIVGWFMIFVFAFPFIFLFGIPYVFYKKVSFKNLVHHRENLKSEKDARNFLLIPLIFIFSIALLSFNPLTPPTLRYLLALFPLAYIILAAMMDKIYEKRKIAAVALIVLLIVCNVLYIFPFFMFKAPAQKFMSLKGYSENDEKKFLDKTLSLNSYFPMYVYEITHKYESAVMESVNYINSKENPAKIKSESIFTNTDQMALGFYTGMNSTDNSSKLCSRTYEWIVIYEKSKDIYKECFNPNNYDRFEIANNADNWVETPDLTSHRFKTKRDGIINVYRLKE